MTETAPTEAIAVASVATEASPREVIDTMLAHLKRRDYGAISDQFTEDGVCDMPFMGPNVPRHLERRDQIKKWMVAAAEVSPIILGGIEDLIVYPTTDPELWFLEFTGFGTISTNGHRYRTSYLLLLRIVDGQISYYRQYNESGAAIIAAATPPTDET